MDIRDLGVDDATYVTTELVVLTCMALAEKISKFETRTETQIEASDYSLKLEL